MGRTGVGPTHLQGLILFFSFLMWQGLILITLKMGIGPITNGHPSQTQHPKAQKAKLLTIWSLQLTGFE